jgi:hypothetical protein
VHRRHRSGDGQFKLGVGAILLTGNWHRARIDYATAGKTKGKCREAGAGYLPSWRCPGPASSGQLCGLVTGVTLALYPPEGYRNFIRQALRVAMGLVVYVGIPPGWYGGDLYDVIENPLQNKIDAEVDRIFLEEFLFSFKDIFSEPEYGTVEHIVSTYGFIFGSKAIEH